MPRKTVPVTGMSCGGCEQNVEDALASLDGVTDVNADHDGDTVEVVTENGVAETDIHAAIEDAGYDVSA